MRLLGNDFFEEIFERSEGSTEREIELELFSSRSILARKYKRSDHCRIDGITHRRTTHSIDLIRDTDTGRKSEIAPSCIDESSHFRRSPCENCTFWKHSITTDILQLHDDMMKYFLISSTYDIIHKSS